VAAVKVTRILEIPLVYRLWMAPWAERKLAPVLSRVDLSRVRRVLDVGCGPGTNTPHFQGVDYLGIDINEQYVEQARRRFGKRFIAADVTQYRVADDERFDLILVNSLLHHIDGESSHRLLSHLGGLLSDDGRVHIIELVRPPEKGMPRRLADWDRGEYPRPAGEWRDHFNQVFHEVAWEPFELHALGVKLWEMVYYQGRARR
jgi:SAM-dependent methyltransferase